MVPFRLRGLRCQFGSAVDGASRSAGRRTDQSGLSPYGHVVASRGIDIDCESVCASCASRCASKVSIVG